MLERTLVFVDTSYLLASFYNSWEAGARGQLEIDLREVVTVLDNMITQQLNQPVQRQLWYDGIPESGPHRYQRSLRTIDGVQLRAGQLIEWGDRRTQKAVDTRLVADMVIAGLRNQASDIVLVSGDADMLPGVSEATAAGVRVHLYGFGWDSMSGALRHACDSTTILDPREDFADAMQINVLEGPIPPVVRTNKPLGDAEPIEDLGATRVPDTRITPPGEDTENTPLADDSVATLQTAGGDNEGSDSSASNPTRERPTSLSQTPNHDANCYRNDNAAATPTAKADSPKFNELEHAAKMGAREISAQAQHRAEVGHIGMPSETADRSASERSAQPEQAARPTSTSQPTPPAPTVRQSAHQDAAHNGALPHDGHTETPVSPAAMPGANSIANSAETARNSEANTTAATTAAATTGDGESTTESSSSRDGGEGEGAPKPAPRPNPSMMAPRRKLRSRYVPLPNEVWASAGFQTPFDVGQQYANWWYENIATEHARDSAHLLSGGGLPPDIDRPLLQFACETLHEYTLTETQRVNLRDGFHAGIRGVLLARKNGKLED